MQHSTVCGPLTFRTETELKVANKWLILKTRRRSVRTDRPRGFRAVEDAGREVGRFRRRSGRCCCCRRCRRWWLPLPKKRPNSTSSWPPFGDKKINVIKEVRAITGLGLGEPRRWSKVRPRPSRKASTRRKPKSSRPSSKPLAPRSNSSSSPKFAFFGTAALSAVPTVRPKGTAAPDANPERLRKVAGCVTEGRCPEARRLIVGVLDNCLNAPTG